MFKKIGMSLLLVFAMLVSMFNFGTVTTVYATPSCTTIQQCRELQRTARNNIADILEQEEELGEDIALVQGEISVLRDEISELEGIVRGLESEIDQLAIEIGQLAIEVDNNLEILEATELDTDALIDEIAQRMRITQRVNNTNSLLTMLTEAESLAGFIRVTRTFNRIALEDAELMEELTRLIEFQENLLVQLGEQQEQIEASRNGLELRVAELEVEQDRLEIVQIALIAREADMQDRLYILHADRVDEEGRLAAISEAEEILARTPPPPVTSSNNSSSSSASQTPNASGLAHPMPGAIVTDEFGTRGGTHRGIDLAVVGNPSAPILAAASGTVTIAAWEAGMGWYVVIEHNINGQRIGTLYGHLRDAPPVSPGTVVEQGQVIGTKGSTGISSGPHLHFEVHSGGFSWGSNRGVNPRSWINF